MTSITTPRPSITRRRRAWIRILAVLAITFLVLLVGLRLFLGSQHARRLAAERIGNLLGMKVEVENLDIGSTQTEVQLRIVDSPATSEEAPAEVFRVQSVKADISLIDILTGRTQPKELILKGVAITLAFDRDGKIHTTIPHPTGRTDSIVWPRIRIEDAAITLRREGRPDFHLDHVQLTAERRDDRYQLNGTIQDAKWGEWTLAGSFAGEAETGWVELKTPDGPLDTEMIRSIPSVPESMWKHVRTAGRSEATVRFEWGVANVFHYSVLLQPAGRAQVTISDLAVPLTEVHGDIRIHGQQVILDKCRGRLAGGSVDVNGTLDFEPATSKLALDVKAAALDVTKLPAEWSLPSQITGKLHGEAKLKLLIPPDGNVQPHGGGTARIEDARIAGLPAEVRLRLRGDGRRYRFESDQAFAPQPDATVPVVFYPAPPIPSAALPAKATTLETSITFRDVNIIELIRHFEVDIPQVGGKVTLKVVAIVPAA